MAWTHRGPFNWDGSRYQFKNVSIWPQPVSDAPFVMSCKSPESVQLGVAHQAVMAEIYVKNKGVLENFNIARRQYVMLSRDAGWEPDDGKFCLSVPRA